MSCSSFVCPWLPGGRGPNATISFTYCITWLPLMSGLGAALPELVSGVTAGAAGGAFVAAVGLTSAVACCLLHPELTDRKTTRLNSSHLGISYAVFCLNKKLKATI